MHKKEKLMCVIIGFKSPSSPLETIVLLANDFFVSYKKQTVSSFKFSHSDNLK